MGVMLAQAVCPKSSERDSMLGTCWVGDALSAPSQSDIYGEQKRSSYLTPSQLFEEEINLGAWKIEILLAGSGVEGFLLDYLCHFISFIKA